jgi:actin-like protein 6A
MEVDPPTTTANANGDAAPAAQKPWKKRGLRALNHPHLQPPDHMEVLQTISNGLATDWDLWDTIVEEALVYALL